MSLGFLKPVGGVMRLRYARPGYDANDFTLPGNLVAFDSANSGIFSIYASGLWRGDASALTSRTQIISWPSLSYKPICTIYVDGRGSSYSDSISYGFLGNTVSNFQTAEGNNGMEIANDGIYWKYNGGGTPDHTSVWWWVHRMYGAP